MNTFYEAFSFDNPLANFCSQEETKLVNLWQHFLMRPDMFGKDGLHLSDLGAARAGRLLSESTQAFWSKNEARVEQALSLRKYFLRQIHQNILCKCAQYTKQIFRVTDDCLLRKLRYLLIILG